MYYLVNTVEHFLLRVDWWEQSSGECQQETAIAATHWNGLEWIELGLLNDQRLTNSWESSSCPSPDDTHTNQIGVHTPINPGPMQYQILSNFDFVHLFSFGEFPLGLPARTGCNNPSRGRHKNQQSRAAHPYYTIPSHHIIPNYIIRTSLHHTTLYNTTAYLYHAKNQQSRAAHAYYTIPSQVPHPWLHHTIPHHNISYQTTS